jgi:hypothetical protein
MCLFSLGKVLVGLSIFSECMYRRISGTMRIFGGCAGGTPRLFHYARSLRRLPRFLVLTAQPPDVVTVLVLKRKKFIADRGFLIKLKHSKRAFKPRPQL